MLDHQNNTMAGADHQSAPVDDGTLADLMQRYENIKVFDAHKNALIEELLKRYEYLSDSLLQERAEYDHHRRIAAEELEQSQHNTLQLKSLFERDPFVLVVIDGADLVFRNTFLRDGDNGGRRCAALFQQAINEYVFSTIDELPPETKIIVRMYADLEILPELCLQSNVIDQSAKVRSFFRGFVQDKTLFDVVNVYSQGRESIIDKVEAQIHQHLHDLRCRHIMLGCSDSDIYGRMLKEITKKDECMAQRLTLLSGVPPDKELAVLPFEMTRMTHIFRNTKLEVHKGQDYLQCLEVESANMLPCVINTQLGVITPPLSTPTLSVRSDSRLGDVHPRTPSLASSTTSLEPALSKPTTWASISKKASALPVTISDKLIVKQPTLSGIRRNKLGQRLDPPPPEYKKDEVNRVKKLKLCNAHYLRGDCPYATTKCEHEHFYKCTKSEIETLRLVARMSACIYGSACDEEKCIYGHCCPFPSAKEGSMRGKGCLNGENCRFPDHMHGMDMIPVKLSKVI